MSSELTPARTSIYDAAAANRWRTIALIAAFTALIALLGYFVGEYFAPGGGLAALPFAFALSIGGAFASYFAGDHLFHGELAGTVIHVWLVAAAGIEAVASA